MLQVVWRFIFFFMKKTSYELCISDWSSDVCSSDLESVSVKGPKGTLSIAKSADIDVKIENGQAQLSTSDAEKVAITGTLRAIIANMVHGVSEGFARKLELAGVG